MRVLPPLLLYSFSWWLGDTGAKGPGTLPTVFLLPETWWHWLFCLQCFLLFFGAISVDQSWVPPSGHPLWPPHRTPKILSLPVTGFIISCLKPMWLFPLPLRSYVPSWERWPFSSLILLKLWNQVPVTHIMFRFKSWEISSLLWGINLYVAGCSLFCFSLSHYCPSSDCMDDIIS